MDDEKKAPDEDAEPVKRKSLDGGAFYLGLLRNLAAEYIERNEAFIKAHEGAGDTPIRYIHLEGKVDMRSRGQSESTLFSYGVVRFNEGDGLNAAQNTIIALAQLAPRIEGMIATGLQLDTPDVKPHATLPEEWTKV